MAFNRDAVVQMLKVLGSNDISEITVLEELNNRINNVSSSSDGISGSLGNYVKKSEIGGYLADYVQKNDLNNDLNNYVKKTEIGSIQDEIKGIKESIDTINNKIDDLTKLVNRLEEEGNN